MDLNLLNKKSEEIKIFKKWFKTYSSNGVKIFGDGRNLLILEKENIKYFLFIEPLCTSILSWQIDWDSLSLDEKFQKPVEDKNTKIEILATAIAHFHKNKNLVADIDSLEGL